MNENHPKIVGIIILLIMIVFLSGCTTTPLLSPELHGNVQWTGDWSVGLGCYNSVTGYVYNSGSGDAKNVVVILSLIDTNTGILRDSKTLTIGSVRKGESKNFQTTLNGDCGRNYKVEFTFQ